MQRLIGLLGRVRERPPSGSAPAPGAAGASELRKEGWGGLHSAAASGDLPRLQRRWWRKRFRINGRDAEKQTPLHLACANGHADVVRFLAGKKCRLNPRDNSKKSPLMKAVEHQHKDCVAILLEHGANPDLRGAGGNTALHLAATIPSKSLVELLLEHNAHIDAQNEIGYTPLTVAITERCEEMVEFLLQKGADVHARDRHERTTLMVAAAVRNMNAIRLLLRHGADLSHEDQFGKTALSYTRLSGYADIHNQWEEYVNCERTAECSAGGTEGPAVLDSSRSGTTADFPLGAPAMTGAGVLPAAGAEQEEDDDSPFDSETDSEGPRKGPASMLLPAADRHGACTQSVAEERSNGVLPAAGVVQLEDFDSFSENEVLSLPEVTALGREERQLKKDASTQADCRGDRQTWVRQLQQGLADALKKNSLAEASLEAKKRYSRDLQEQKLQLQKELDRSKAKLQELRERRTQTECYAESLKNAIKNKKRELTTSRNLQGLLVASSRTAAIPELEERKQRLQVEKARLEATAQQQAKTIETLEKVLQASASARKGLEDLITGFQTTRTAKEHQHQQRGSESKEVKKLAKMKCRSEALLDETRGRNVALEEERTRLKMLLEGLQTKLMAYAGRKRESQLSSQGEMKNSCSEVANEVGKQRRRKQVTNAVSMDPHLTDCHRSGDAVKKTHAAGNINPGPARKVVHSAWDSGRTRAEPGLNLRSCWETSMVGHSQLQQPKREMGERAGQEIRQNPQEVDPYVHVTQFSTCVCSPKAASLLLTHFACLVFGIWICALVLYFQDPLSSAAFGPACCKTNTQPFLFLPFHSRS